MRTALLALALAAQPHGTYHRKITTGSPEAQRDFDQGLRLLYGFNHDEAIRSFEACAKADPVAPLCPWGIAVALGPNINLPQSPEREQRAHQAAEQAVALAAKEGTEVEKGLCAAVAVRYAAQPTPDPTGALRSRRARDQAYAQAMRTLAQAHPEDDDVLTLFAESLMDLRPWDFWTKEGKPQPGTEEMLATLEKVLARNPNHPGANHYDIHVLESSPHPERALAAAGRLPRLLPDVGHAVHMPSHVYIHTGQYAEATQANEQAIAVDKKYLAGPHAEGMYAMMYTAHNVQFLWWTAMMEGRSKEALQAARDLVARFPPEMVKAMGEEMAGVDYQLAPVLLTQVRFGRWKEVLAERQPPKEYLYLTALWRYARARAQAGLGKHAEAATEREAFAKAVAALPADATLSPTNTASAVFGVVAKVLDGELLAAQGKLPEAQARLAEAVSAEDALGYDEPPPFYQPARQSLGAVLLAEGQPAEAERVYREDLVRNPENGWSLFGLAQSLRAQKKPEADAIDARFKKAWARADVKLTASRF